MLLRLLLIMVFLQEAIVVPPWVALAVRPRPGVWEYVRVNVHELVVEQLSVPEYLKFKEALVDERYCSLLSTLSLLISLFILPSSLYVALLKPYL